MKLEDKLLDKVDVLSEKLNGLGTHAWDSLIKYEVLTGIAQLVGAFLILLFVFFTVLFIKKQYNKAKKTGEDNFIFENFFGNEFENKIKFTEGGRDISALLIAVSILGLVFSVFLIYYGIMRISVPEIYAIKEILNQIK